jgi:hypothetical protein
MRCGVEVQGPALPAPAALALALPAAVAGSLPHLAEVVAITQDPTESNHYTLVWRESSPAFTRNESGPERGRFSVVSVISL